MPNAKFLMPKVYGHFTYNVEGHAMQSRGSRGCNRAGAGYLSKLRMSGPFKNG